MSDGRRSVILHLQTGNLVDGNDCLWNSCAFLTIEVKFQAVGIDMVKRNAKLSGYMLHNAAKPSRNEEDLHVTLM